MTSEDVAVGEILHFYSTHTAPRKDKFHVCVAPNSCFLINTLPNFPPTVPVSQKEYPFLSHDSHICCSLLCEFDSDRFIPDDARRGRISKETAKAILSTLPTNKPLTPVQKKLIVQALAPLA